MSAEQMHTPLKPCPFCGESNQLFPSYRHVGGGKLEGPYAIDCIGCGIDFVPREGMDVVAAWNTRADAASSQERIAQLEARVAEAEKVIAPLAQAADDLDDKHADRSEIWEAPAAMSITAGHLRAARAFIAAAPERIVGDAK